MKFDDTRVFTGDHNPHLIIEYTQLRLSAARTQGYRGGRSEGLIEAAQISALATEALYKKGDMSANKNADNLSINKTNLYRYLRHQSVEIGHTRSGNKLA